MEISSLCCVGVRDSFWALTFETFNSPFYVFSCVFVRVFQFSCKCDECFLCLESGPFLSGNLLSISAVSGCLDYNLHLLALMPGSEVMPRKQALGEYGV